MIGDIDRTKFPEPSGIVFHPVRKTLFVVGDEGDLCEIRTDGTPVHRKHFPAGAVRMDFEGFTVNPDTGLIYAAIEGAESILEIDPGNLEIKRKFDIDRTLNNELLMAHGGQGIEGIAFMPDPGHPQGGTFLVVNQSFRLDDPHDISAVFEIEVPLKRTDTASSCKLLRRFSLDVTDLSGLHYDAVLCRLFIISDFNDLLIVAEPDGRVISKYTNLPCADQEGITFDDAGNLYIAQDSGGIVKIRWPGSQTQESISVVNTPVSTD